MSRPRRVLVTGGAGFIGSNLVRWLTREEGCAVVTLDRLTYAGSRAGLRDLEGAGHRLVQGDVRDRALLRRLLDEAQPDAILHLAAETHVDRSIRDATPFVETNLLGTHALLEEALRYWGGLAGEEREGFRLLAVSTDEVFGSLGADGRFSEASPYDPSSPYAATKAGADHLVRCFQRTHGLPTIVTHCSNNYGPYQHPEKLIPLTITRALAGEALPVYGRGENVRDWLHVEDHCRALWTVLTRGAPGESYVIGGRSERQNLEVVRGICRLLDELAPAARPHEELITFVADRPGHDLRYAIDPGRLERELGWWPREGFESGLARTVRWYLEHREWVAEVAAGLQAFDWSARVGLSSAPASGLAS